MSGPAARVAFVTVTALLAACGIPRDPEHTLDRVRHYGQVRVGICENPPWVIGDAGEPRGAEAALIRDFAREIGATPVWIRGTDQQHMEALERFELDLAIAGLDSTTPWKKKVGFTRPYFTEKIMVGVPASTEPPASLAGTKIAVRNGDPAAALLRDKDASPERVPEISSSLVPAAAPEWRIEQLGLQRTKFTLMTIRHVVAIPPGENAWLKQLEEFLFRRQADVPGLLGQAAKP